PGNSDGITSVATTSINQNVAHTASTARSTVPLRYSSSDQTSSAALAAAPAAPGPSQDAPSQAHVATNVATPATAAARSRTTNWRNRTGSAVRSAVPAPPPAVAGTPAAPVVMIRPGLGSAYAECPRPATRARTGGRP